MRCTKILLCIVMIFFAAVSSGCSEIIKDAAESASKVVLKGTKTNDDDKVDDVQTDNKISDNDWIKDQNSGVFIWNPELQVGKNISWIGAAVRDGDKLYAQGFGTVLWYEDGQVVRRDDGTFERGKHHGQFKHIFPNGETTYSNWNHGEKLATPAAPDTKPAAPDNDSEAKQAFIKYHKAITNGNYRQAYDMLSNSQKEYVGDFNSYASGFANTISSEVTDIRLVSSDGTACTFDYTLTARDRYKGTQTQVQIFKGQVIMIKDGGRWYVNYAASNKVSERYE